MRGAGRPALCCGIHTAGGFDGRGPVLLRAGGSAAGGGSVGDGTGGGLRFVGRTPSSAAGPSAGFSGVASTQFFERTSGSQGTRADLGVCPTKTSPRQ